MKTFHKFAIYKYIVNYQVMVRMRRTFFSLLFILIPLCVLSQEEKLNLPKHYYANIAFGGKKRASDSLRVTSVNIGLSNHVDSLNGFQFGLVKAGVQRSLRGVSLSGLLSGNFGNTYGFQSGGATAATSGQMHGVQIGLQNFAGELHGLQIGAFTNLTGSPLHGVQMAGVSNVAKSIERGTQIGLINITSHDQRGVQIGGYNYADTLRGVQFGFLNVTNRNPKGMQIGVINLSGERDSRHLGLVNINPRTRIQFMTFVGNYDKISAGVRFRNRSSYYILEGGAYHAGLGTSHYSGSIGYRVGQYFNLTPKLSLSTDIGFSHIETFQEKTSKRPERLYSLQWRVNADYQFNRWLGAFVSAGAGQTRWYNHHRKFEDKAIIEAGLTVDLRPFHDDTFVSHTEKVKKYAEEFDLTHGDSAQLARDSIFAYTTPRFLKKHPWNAAAEVAGINAFVNLFDRFIIGGSYAKVNFSTIADNFRNGFVWDNDEFSTNQFAHPYHGNLYFNSARTNGLNFWESLPYSLGGSLMWEFFGENEPPAINDVISTSIGGAAIGEVFYRTSALALDDSQRGWPRFWRELAAAVINPIQGLNRLISGDAWRVKSSHYLYHDYNRIPVDASVIVGERYVADEGYIARGSHNLRLGLHIEYGDAFADEKTVPYDYFTADIGMNFGRQPFLSDVHLIGRLYAHNIYEGKKYRLQWGIFQHFDYYSSDSIRGSEMKKPFEISETAAFGPGLIMQIPSVGSMSLLEQRFFINGILLGGSRSDYYNFIDRDYNIGSGFGIKSNTLMEFKKFGFFALNIEYYRLFTWKGYEDKNIDDPNFDPLFLNAQGDKSNAGLLVIMPTTEIHLAKGWNLLMRGAYYNRMTHYSYHDNKFSQTYEVTVGFAYHF